MHIHYLTLRHIATWLKKQLIGCTLVEAFSQQKDELVMGLCNDKEEFWLRISCGMPLPHLWPVTQYRKARKNVVELFSPLRNQTVTGIRLVPWERVLTIAFEEGWEAVLKMHGVQSNVLLRKDGEIREIFRQQKSTDLKFEAKGGELNWSALTAGEDIGKAIKVVSPALDKNFADRLRKGEALEPQLKSLLAEAENPHFHIRRKGETLQFLLFDPHEAGAIQKEGILPSLNFFFRNFFLLRHYSRMHEETGRLIEKPLKKAKNQETSYFRNLENLENKRSDEEIGHILMAHLHTLVTGLEKAELHDFYNDAPIVIKLKPELNPQQNAEVYYQKHKKRKTKNKHLENLIEGLQATIDQYQNLKTEFSRLPSPRKLEFSASGFDYSQVKRLQKFRKQHEKLLQSGQKKQQQAQQRFMEFEKDGFRIYVGRNAKNNDELSLHFARKEDLWLHAKDVTGSHVVVRNPGGKPVPTPVLEYAASLAAYFSKRRGEEWVPVQYTPKKYIRKTRHLAPGEVIVEREEVVLIEPKPFTE